MSLPTGWANAAACAWQKTTWDLPTGATVGRVDGYDGSRYAVGATGRLGQFGTIADARGTLWDNGTVALRIPGATPHVRDVNAAGLIVGDDVVNDSFVAVTIGRDGRSTVLADPAWSSYTAKLVNNAGDIVGSASIGVTSTVVVWPASAPGTYRELPTPNVDTLFLTDVDEQGRIIAQTSSGDGGGFVWDTDGQWRVLAAQGTGDFGTPMAVRDGQVVGAASTTPQPRPNGTRGAGSFAPSVVAPSPGGPSAATAPSAATPSSARNSGWCSGATAPSSTRSRPSQPRSNSWGSATTKTPCVGSEAFRPSHYRCS